MNSTTSTTTTQYRVTFTYLDNVGGSMRRVVGSSRWFDSRAAAERSAWVGAGMIIPHMSMDDAKIETREYQE